MFKAELIVVNYVSRRCTHAFTSRRGACTRHSSSPDSHTDGQPSEERRVIHVRGTGCCPSLPLSPVKIHGQFSLISNDVSKREGGREGQGTHGPSHRKWHTLCPLIFTALLFPSRPVSSLVPRCPSNVNRAFIRCASTVYAQKYIRSRI